MDARRNFNPEEPKVMNGDILFADYMEQWLDIIKRSVAVPTFASYSTTVKKIVAPYFREKEVTLKNGRKFHALLQVKADKRDVEFVPGQKNQNQAQRLADSRRGQNNDPSDTQQNQGNESDGKRQRRNRSWPHEAGSIRPIKKWKDDTFTEQQINDYVAGKTVVLANAKDDQGQPCTKYLKFSFEKGRPLTYSQNPDLAQTVAPSNESRTQLAVNNEGKTNEATKHVKEPLQQGQTAPKDETQQKRQTKKSKGMKVS